MISSLCPESELKGTLLTREQVEDISTRISKIVYEKCFKAIGESNGIRIRKAVEKGKKQQRMKTTNVTHSVSFVIYTEQSQLPFELVMRAKKMV